ncbi:MAG: HAD family hydrolase [Proteobacteria bacterium]|nr:HAD family hydrolase [Pseudomonadota bacterium]
MEQAVIFDVDGVLLDLTAAEEDCFFAAFAAHCDPAALSRDWNAYEIRNDDDITDEIIAKQGIAPALKPRIVDGYLSRLAASLATGGLNSVTVPGAAGLLDALHGTVRIGTATANFREAARLRLVHAGLWPFVEKLAFGADGGGHKHQILARAIAASGLPPERIVYVGDNTNDVQAGLMNRVHFIGFSQVPGRLATLRQAGATSVSDSHAQTLELIRRFLNL